MLGCLFACRPAAVTEPPQRDEPRSVLAYYSGTEIVVSDDEAKAARGDAAAVRKLLDGICHSDGEVTEHLCLYPFPKVLASQPHLVVAEAPHVCADITDRLVHCVHFSISGLPPSLPIVVALKRMNPSGDAEPRIRDALVTALENPDPDWP